MGINAAVTSREMAQKILKAEKAIKQGFFNERALLKIMEKRVKYGLSGTKLEWYVRNVPSDNTTTFGNPSGELAVLTFEEQQPANRVELPFCYAVKTYGVSDRTIEANKNAGANKIYDAVAENLTLAQLSMYDCYAPAIYNPNGASTEDPVGLMAACGNPIHTGGAAVIAAGATYAGKMISTAGFTGTSTLGLLRDKTTIALGTSYDDAQWCPCVASIEHINDAAGTPSLAAWSTGSIEGLAGMADLMSLTRTVSGTGKQIKPDYAFMKQGPFSMLKSRLITSQIGVRGVALGRADLIAANFPNIVVDTLTCVKDDDVPNSPDGTARILIIDSTEFHIDTTHTASEGLIKADFDPNIGIINGAVGTLKANLLYRVGSPSAVGCIVGCSD
jgi:hypothetical protein